LPLDETAFDSVIASSTRFPADLVAGKTLVDNAIRKSA